MSSILHRLGEQCSCFPLSFKFGRIENQIKKFVIFLLFAEIFCEFIKFINILCVRNARLSHYKIFISSNIKKNMSNVYLCQSIFQNEKFMSKIYKLKLDFKKKTNNNLMITKMSQWHWRTERRMWPHVPFVVTTPPFLDSYLLIELVIGLHLEQCTQTLLW